MWTSTVKVPPFSARIHSYSTRTCCMTNASPRHLLSLQTGCKNSARWLASRGVEERRARRWWVGRRFSPMKQGGYVLFEQLVPLSAGVTCGSVEDEVKSEALHRRRLEGKMRWWTRLERPVWPVHHWHTLLRSASQRGTRGEMMRHYVFLAKAVIVFERLWTLLLCTCTKYLSLCSFPQLHMCVHIYKYRLIQTEWIKFIMQCFNKENNVKLQQRHKYSSHNQLLCTLLKVNTRSTSKP